MFSQDMYMEILDNDEIWVVTKEGSAMIVSDASLMDC